MQWVLQLLSFFIRCRVSCLWYLFIYMSQRRKTARWSRFQQNSRFGKTLKLNLQQQTNERFKPQFLITWFYRAIISMLLTAVLTAAVLFF